MLGIWQTLFGSSEPQALHDNPLALPDDGAMWQPADAALPDQQPFWGNGQFDGNLLAAQQPLHVEPIDPFYGDGTCHQPVEGGDGGLGW